MFRLLLVSLLVACETPAVVAPAPRAPEVLEAPAPPPSTHRHSFDIGSAHIGILDLHMQTVITLPAGATLAVNGGFFDRAGVAEGYVVSEGRLLSSYDRGLGGGVLVITGGIAVLHDGESFQPTAELPEFAIQAKPRLVVDGEVNIRSESGRRAARTALCIKDEGRTLLVVVAPAPEGEGPTLLELSRELAEEGCQSALNLDGGPSTALATPSLTYAPRGPLRHAIVFRR